MAKSIKDSKIIRELECIGKGVSSGIEDIIQGNNIVIDKTDPKKPVISSTGGGSGGAVNVTPPIIGSGIPANPIGILSASTTSRGTMSISHYNKLEGVDFSTFMLTTQPANDITNTNITNWNTAFGWGNHASMGYITASSTDALTNKTGNISMWNNDSNYITNTVLNTTLNNYVLNSTLANYSTTTTVNNQLALKENLNSKVISWTATPNNTNYPSEKLVKDTIDSINTNTTNKLDKVLTAPQTVASNVTFNGLITYNATNTSSITGVMVLDTSNVVRKADAIEILGDDGTATKFTITELNTAYPNAISGFRLICPNISTTNFPNGAVYVKTTIGWAVEKLYLVTDV